MEPTHLSFIQQLSDRSEEAWRELESVYRPMILNWLRRYPLQAVDAEDLAQEVMTTVVERIGDFQHNGRIGAFRNWLRTTAVNQARTYLRKNNIRPTARGSDTFVQMLQQLEDPNSHLTGRFNREHDQYVVRLLLKRASSQFQEVTIQAFRLHLMEGVDSAETGKRLGISATAVRIAKCRVLKELREQAEDWIDEAWLS